MLCLGTGEFGQLGLGEVTTIRKKPALVKSNLEERNIKKIVAGGVHTVCLTDDHQVMHMFTSMLDSLRQLLIPMILFDFIVIRNILKFGAL